MSLTPIQNEIQRALIAMEGRSHFTDAQLAKKVRELSKIDGKKKAVLALADVMAAIESLEGDVIYKVTVTNANDLLIERSDEPKELALEAKQRRQRHEKSQQLFTSSDLAVHGDGGKPKHTGYGGKKGKPQRTERKQLNVNAYFDD